ncbi:unnamed protein product [Candidula unifasciata]|uniref:Neugrin n=1 Tax=Candidula unifasciata TaxID=100452 RepID=A0A8S4A1P6_9EUPU|nr:unnamed protein product [Candidula unifasciata]
MLRSILNRNILWKFKLEINSQSEVNFQACFRHSVAGAGTLRPLKVTSREHGRREDKNKMDQYPRRGERRHFTEEFDDAEELDNLASSISKYTNKRDANMIKQLKTHRYKTLEHKFFRKPSPPDLLTWAAKEQIRYLHSLDPEEYSVEALSDLFPVSEEIIKQMIKSKIRMIREKDMLQHDENVQKNWEDLMASLENEDPAISDKLQAFKNSQGEIIIQNATGVKDLPFSERNTDRFFPRGEFSAIVKDCYDAKKKALKEAREELQAKSEDISAVLSKVSEKIKMTSERKTTSSRLLKLKNKSTFRTNNSTAHRTEQLANRNTTNSGPVIQENNVQQNVGTIMVQKYKDSLLNDHAEECQNMKRNIARKIPVKPEAQQRNSSATYISGDCVYDKSGTFLYRIP